MSTPIDLMIRHASILTMDETRRILPDGAIAISGGRITAIGPDREVAPAFEAQAIRNVGGALVHPGLIDGHSHLDMDLVRHLLPEAREFGVVENPYSSTKTPEEEHLSTLLTCMEMVASGTTSFADTGKTFDLESAARAVELVGLRGMPGHFATDGRIPEDTLYDLYYSPARPTAECLELLDQQTDRYPFHGDARVRCVVALQAQGTASDDLLIGAKALADRKRIPLIFHQSWSEAEVENSLAAHHQRPIEHLADIGVLGPNVTLVHAILVDEREIELLAESGTSTVFCPNAVRRGMGVIRDGRYPEMLEAGVTVALGSDGWGGKSDIARQAFLAATLFREFRNEMPVITADRALEMATLHGARALGLQDEVGSLEVGKRADIVIHSTNRPGPRAKDPVHRLIYYWQSETVDTVLVEGEVIYDQRHFTRFDERDALERIDAAASAREQAIDVRGSHWPIVE